MHKKIKFSFVNINVLFKMKHDKEKDKKSYIK